MILGLDFGLSTGFAVMTADSSIIMYGGWNNKNPLEGRKAEVRTMRLPYRFCKFRDQTISVLEAHPNIHTIAYEYVWRHPSSKAAQAYAGWLAVLMTVCGDRNIKPWPVAWSTVKSVACPNGIPAHIKALKGKKYEKARRSFWKKELLAAATRRWDVSPSTDDESDAIWVAEACRLGRGTIR